jgi:hypothetical protein
LQKGDDLELSGSSIIYQGKSVILVEKVSRDNRTVILRSDHDFLF